MSTSTLQEKLDLLDLLDDSIAQIQERRRQLLLEVNLTLAVAAAQAGFWICEGCLSARHEGPICLVCLRVSTIDRAEHREHREQA